MRHVLLLLLLLLLLLPPFAAVPARAEDARPNVVLVLLDDLRADDLPHLPNVQRLLVEQGTTLPNFFLTTPLCCPSRASILSGRYAHNHGVLDNTGPAGGHGRFLPAEEEALAARLDAAGYRTGLFGKYLNEYPEGVPDSHVPPGWDDWAAFLDDGSKLYVDYRLNEDGAVRGYGSDEADYSTDVLRRKAVAFVADAAAGGEPFFALFAPRAPHGPATPAPRHAELFAGEEAPRLPSFDEADVSDKSGVRGELPRLGKDERAAIDRHHRHRLRSLQAVDEAVAGLVEALAATGALAETYVVLASDNGYHQGEHRIVHGKGTPYEESVRVPLVVRGPGVPGARADARPAANIDLAPTIAAWAGVPLPGPVDGRSLAPVLAGDDPGGWRTAVLLESFRNLPSGESAPLWAAVRTERHTYVEWGRGERMLYDLAVDPHQLENLLAPGREPPPEAAELAARLARLRPCAGDGCRAAEDGS